MPYFSDRPQGASPFFIVIHTGEGSLTREDCANYLGNNPNASAHAFADAGGVITPPDPRAVPYSRAAWTAGSTANSYGLHVELCAFACMTRAQWLSEADVDVWVPWLNNGAGANRRVRSPLSMLRNTAAWVRDRCQEFGITVRKVTAADLLADRDGICGHADTSAAWHETDHTDPGPGFPWAEFIALVNGAPIQQQEDSVSVKDVTESWYGPRFRGDRNFAQVVHNIEDLSTVSNAKLDGLTNALGALSTNKDITPDAVRKMLDESVAKATPSLAGQVAAKVAEELRPELVAILGEDNAAQADEILARMADRLRLVASNGQAVA